jgi:NitT/TauT family transport system permease protein
MMRRGSAWRTAEFGDGPLSPSSLSRRLSPRVWAPPLVAFGVLAAAWQLYATANRFVLPTLPEVAGALLSDPGLYLRNLLVTLQEALVGAACGMALGFLGALAITRLPLAERALMPVAVVINVTPIVAIAPGLVVAFGFGMLPRYIVTAVVVFFPFLINSIAGLKAVDPGAEDVFTTLHASRFEVLLRLRIPSSVPYLLAGARICLPLALIGAVVAEFSAAGQSAGLGSLVETAASQADLPVVYASVFVLGLLGIGLTLLVIAAGRGLSIWYGDLLG